MQFGESDLTFKFLIIKWGILVELKSLPTRAHTLCSIFFSYMSNATDKFYSQDKMLKSQMPNRFLS